jgi:hypothetical protein
MLRWAGHVARIAEKRNAYKVLLGKAEEERRCRFRLKDNIKMNPKRREDMVWVHLSQDKDPANMVIHLLVPQNSGYYFH